MMSHRELYFHDVVYICVGMIGANPGSAAPTARPQLYPFDRIEPQWQAYWETHKTFRKEGSH